MTSLQMCTSCHRYYPLIGRVLLSLIFIAAGFGKFQTMEGTSQMLASAGLPSDPAFVYLVGLFELVAGLAILAGAFAREVAYLLIGFTILATFLYHTDFSGPDAQLQQIMFLKNLAIVGGLFLVAAVGAGSWSVDETLRKKAHNTREA